MTDEEIAQFRSLAKQMDIAIDGFMASFSQRIFAHTRVIDSVRQIAEIRGRADIVERIDSLNAPTPR